MTRNSAKQAQETNQLLATTELVFRPAPCFSEKMDLRFFVIDAFAHQPYSGNPAAVVWVPKEQAMEPQAMQLVAREFNLSETAFVTPHEDGAFGLRWFTPTREVAICGHATLATARALLEWERWDATAPALFKTRESGTLSCTHSPERRLELSFPAIASRKTAVTESMEEALGCPVNEARDSQHSLLLVLESAKQVRECNPTLSQVASIHRRGVLITAAGNEEKPEHPAADFVSRAFFPNYGIPEDPVCGSAHCLLTPFWAERLSRTSLLAEQLSTRGGFLHVNCAQQGGKQRILLAGETAITCKGELTAPIIAALTK